MGDSIYVIKPDTFFSNIAQDSIARNNINKELEINTQQEQKEPSELYNAIKNWYTGDSLAKAEWKQWALKDFEGFKEYYKQYNTLLKNLDIDKLYGAKAKPNRVTSYGTKTDIGKELFQSLLKAGFSEVLALAILANSYHETMGWNKMNLLNNGPATGLLQMEEAARLSYDNFREANNLEENTDALALYIASLFLNGKSIPTTYYDNSGKGEAYTTALALEDWNSGDLSKTVKAFMYSYERPGTPMLDRRLGVALLLSDNKHLFYKEGGSVKRNDIKSTFFAKDGLPGGMLFMYLQPSSTSVLFLSSVLPVEYYDKNIVQSAKALGLTVEEYLKLIEKSNLPGVVYEDSGNDGVNYYRSRTATDPRARDAAAVERQRQDQALEQLRQDVGKAANLLFSLGMPSTYVGLATGAMDLGTGEGKANTAGKIWGNTRLVLDIAVPIAGLSVYKGVRQVPRLYKNLYYKLASPRIGLTRTFNKGLNEEVANAFYLAGQPVNATIDMFGESIPDAKSEWIKFIKQLINKNKNFGQGVWHIDHVNNIPKNNILTDGRGYQYTWWDVSPDIRSGRIGSHTPEAYNTVYYFPFGSKGSNTVLNSPIAPSGHMSYKKVGPIDISEAVKYKWNGKSWIQENNLTLHLQGEDAVRMFKEYGGEAWPEGSSLGEQLLKYVPEARVRYGLQGNSNITDKEIAEALYKQIKSLPGLSLDGTEPILGFRGDTKRYTQLQPRSTPEEMITMGGTMDNSLGTLFLREYPHLYQQGVDRYLVTARPELSSMNPENFAINVEGSSTGAKPINIPKEIAISDYSQMFSNFYEYPIRLGTDRRGNPIGFVYKIKPEYTSTGVNDLNAFMFRGKARNATNEILVANGGRAAGQLNNFNLHVKNKPVKDIADPEGLTYNWNGNEINILEDAGVEKGALRELMGEHYSNLLKEALQNGEGLFVSGRVNPTAKGTHPFRDEHSSYTYIALPNYNIRGAKHILPYDLRIPRDWSDPNMYKALSPVIGGTSLYFSNSKKQGGKLNYLNYFNLFKKQI